MNQTINSILAGALAALVVAVVAFVFFKPKPVPPQPAVPGPEITGPSISVGGVGRWFASQSLNTATTSLCRLRAPVHATSTLVYASLKSTGTSDTTHLATTSPPHGIQLVFARDPGPSPTTTAISAALQVTASKQVTVTASTSPANGRDNIFGPGDYLNIAINNGAAGDYRGYVPRGVCQAEWVID